MKIDSHFALTNGEEDLESLVIMSLYCDARDDENTQKKGFWGDLLGNKGHLGSKLWLLARAARNNETLATAMAYAREALRWMIDDKLIANLDIETTWEGEQLILKVILDKETTMNLPVE